MAVSAGGPKFSAMGVKKLSTDLKKIQLALGKLEHPQDASAIGDEVTHAHFGKRRHAICEVSGTHIILPHFTVSGSIQPPFHFLIFSALEEFSYSRTHEHLFFSKGSKNATFTSKPMSLLRQQCSAVLPNPNLWASCLV